MSSEINVSNASSKPEQFDLKDIVVLVDSEEQNWFKWAHVGKFLGLKHIDTLVEGLDKCEMPARNDIKSNSHGTGGWPGPKDHQNKMDKFLSTFRVMYVIVKSEKDKVKVLRNHILKVLYHVDLMQKLKRSKKSTNKPLKKKIQQFRYSMMT